MSNLRRLVLYASLCLGANAAVADTSNFEALREGSMMKLTFPTEPVEVAKESFTREDGTEGHLSDFAGKFVLVNFWATWCAPCRKEMPGLNALQSELGGDAFEVVTIATGRNTTATITRFFDGIGVTNLPMHRDAQQSLARRMAVFGLPVSIIMNPDGQEIARLRGDADWDSESAKAIFREMIGGS